MKATIVNREDLSDICSRGTKSNITRALNRLIVQYLEKGKPMSSEKIQEFKDAIEKYSKPDIFLDPLDVAAGIAALIPGHPTVNVEFDGSKASISFGKRRITMHGWPIDRPYNDYSLESILREARIYLGSASIKGFGGSRNRREGGYCGRPFGRNVREVNGARMSATRDYEIPLRYRDEFRKHFPAGIDIRNDFR